MEPDLKPKRNKDKLRRRNVSNILNIFVPTTQVQPSEAAETYEIICTNLQDYIVIYSTIFHPILAL